MSGVDNFKRTRINAGGYSRNRRGNWQHQPHKNVLMINVQKYVHFKGLEVGFGRCPR